MPQVVAMLTMEPDTEKEFQAVVREQSSRVIEQSTLAKLV